MTLPRYERPHENGRTTVRIEPETIIPFAEIEPALAASQLSPGSRALLLGLLRTGTTRVFPGGGVGIEYGSLLKTAVRPDDLGRHVREVAEYLMARRIDLLLVPGMSGYPVGAMYSLAANIPAILLKKQKIAQNGSEDYPAGSFAIPSYTGDGDVVISADLDATQHIIAEIVERKIAAHANGPEIEIVIRCAGADDIIDKATMAHAITENAAAFCGAAIADALAAIRTRGDDRAFHCRVETRTWVTPLLKTYNEAREHLRRQFGIDPFAGLSVESVHLDPPALGIEGVGVVAFAADRV